MQPCSLDGQCGHLAQVPATSPPGHRALVWSQLTGDHVRQGLGWLLQLEPGSRACDSITGPRQYIECRGCATEWPHPHSGQHCSHAAKATQDPRQCHGSQGSQPGTSWDVDSCASLTGMGHPSVTACCPSVCVRHSAKPAHGTQSKGLSWPAQDQGGVESSTRTPRTMESLSWLQTELS